MKAIISHDIDHITFWEHYKDMVIPKFYARSGIELFSGKISLKEFFLRFAPIFTNRWNRIEEVMEFNESNGVPATFFIGVNNGLGLSYNKSKSENWIKKIIARGFEIGVHGIAYDNEQDMKSEYETFKHFSDKDNFGIRMHYLRNDEHTIERIEKVGYHFDSTLYDIRNPFFLKDLAVFPLAIMDGYEIENGKPWQTRTLRNALDSTFSKIENAQKSGLKYISILFHDRYFSNAFKTWKHWYIETINFLKENQIELVSYAEAIAEVSKENKQL